MPARLLVVAALLACLPAVTGFAAPLAPVRGRGCGRLGTAPGRKLGLPNVRRRQPSMPALRAANDDEVDFDAFRDLLNDSWETEKAKSPDDGEFDGYKFRDLIVAHWGAAYDIQIKRESFLGKPMIFFNVMWKYYGQQSFPLSEQEYLEHLQYLAELCIRWDRVEHLKEEISKQRKRPNAYFGYAVALPLNLPAEVMDVLNIPESTGPETY